MGGWTDGHVDEQMDGISGTYICTYKHTHIYTFTYIQITYYTFHGSKM